LIAGSSIPRGQVRRPPEADERVTYAINPSALRWAHLTPLKGLAAGTVSPEELTKLTERAFVGFVGE
jgi:hypothetical protein